jgi:hypothetical protein
MADLKSAGGDRLERGDLARENTTAGSLPLHGERYAGGYGRRG